MEAIKKSKIQKKSSRQIKDPALILTMTEI